MDKTEILDNFQDLNSNFKDDFMSSVNSRMKVKINYEKKEIDYSWVGLLEENMIYLENIIRNPKKFIINDEEIVKIELAKKITVESVIHLTQHTSFIQDYNQKTGDVKPSKILNINKEESLDTYENRFIYTLIRNIDTFILQHENDIINGSYLRDEKEINYDASTKVNDEDVNIKLSLNSNNSTKGGGNNSDLKTRLEKVKSQLSMLTGSELMSSLHKLHVAPVRPPLRKTNVILKNPNFQKAEMLWNYFQRYDKNNYTFEKDDRDFYDEGVLKKQFDEGFLFNYLALNTISKDKDKKMKAEKTLSLNLGGIIEMFLDSDESFDKEKIYDIFNREYANVSEKVINRDKIICNVLEENFIKLEKNLTEACTLIDEV